MTRWARARPRIQDQWISFYVGQRGEARVRLESATLRPQYRLYDVSNYLPFYSLSVSLLQASRKGVTQVILIDKSRLSTALSHPAANVCLIFRLFPSKHSLQQLRHT